MTRVSNKTKKPIVALIYDFDGTLAPGNVQEPDFLKQLEIKPNEFWQQTKERAEKYNADHILSYMSLMLEKCIGTSVKVTKSAFSNYGASVEPFPGVTEWFDNITQYGKEKGALIEHYIVSSGTKEIIEGTCIAKKFKKIYACSFIYDQHGVAIAPGLAINYTTKTQFLYRINKGILEEWDNERINAYMKKEDRPIPFSRMIYFGDGATDVPCMKLVLSKNGHSIAVYSPKSKTKKAKAEELFRDGRASYVAPADYSTGKAIDLYVKAVINKIVADDVLEKHHIEYRRSIERIVRQID